MSDSHCLDPRLFDPAFIDSETAAYNAWLEETLPQYPSALTHEPHALREAREVGQSASGAPILSEMAVNRTIHGPAGALPIRVFVPDRVQGVYLHIHGGGWVLGRAHHQDPRNEQIARQCQVAVVSVDYRLAPEYPYPAGPDDCEAAALWLVEHAKREFGSDRLVIGGESAGAHLSALTLLRLRDRHGITGFAGANLVFGCFDLSFTPSAARWGDRFLVLSTPIMRWFFDHYVPRERRREPDVSPLYADLSRMPPALFTVGTLDPLLDDSLFMYARWVAAGNEAELAVYPGGAHGFTGHPIGLASKANARIDEFITRAVQQV